MLVDNLKDDATGTGFSTHMGRVGDVRARGVLVVPRARDRCTVLTS